VIQRLEEDESSCRRLLSGGGCGVVFSGWLFIDEMLIERKDPVRNSAMSVPRWFPTFLRKGASWVWRSAAQSLSDAAFGVGF